MIPHCRNPFVVILNGIRYEYESGKEIEVPDEIAEVIAFHVDSKPKALPYVGGFCNRPHVYFSDIANKLPDDAVDGSLAVVTEVKKGWLKKTWNGFTDISGANIWTDGKNIYFSTESNNTGEQYILKGDTWETKNWNYVTKFDGNRIWTDGKHIYYSPSAHYVLNGDTWEQKTWKGLSDFTGDLVITIGTKAYCRDKGFYNGNETIYHLYVLNGDTWEQTNAISKTEDIWSDGKNIYCSDGGTYNPSDGVVYYGVYKFNGDTFDKVSSVPFRVDGTGFWTDGEIWYYNYQTFDPSIGGMKYAMYTFEDGTFTEMEKMNIFNFSALDVWTDGTDVYLSQVSANSQYVLGEHPKTVLYSRESGEWVNQGEVDFTDLASS
jgi:hypothetical protein